MKKTLALLLALVLALGMLAGCGGSNAGGNSNAGNNGASDNGGAADNGGSDEGGVPGAADVKIVLLLPGEINDQGWNASNYAGVVACNEQLGTSMEYVEAVQEADFESTFREYAERGYDIIMAAGSQFDEAAASVAASYPDTLFMVVNGANSDGDNLCPLFPKEYEASYLAAVIAGNITESGVFGMIGGDPNQAMQDLMAVYGKTAVSIAQERGIADATYNLAYSNSWDDVALGKQMSESMIDEGADVMFVYANELGLGVISGAQEKGAKVVGYSADQTQIDENTVVASIDFDYATMYVWAINEYLDGNLTGHQIVEVGVPEGIYFPVYTDNCPAEAKAACDEAVEALKAGSVDLKALFD
nr:BMP family protein [uncultured Dysosmobacter sp.]